MKLSTIENVLSGETLSSTLHEEIKDEVYDYALLMKKVGASNPLYILEDAHIFINVSGIKRLLNEVLLSNLSNIELAYICDCLSMVEEIDYENDKIIDIVHGIADPEINGGFLSEERIKNLLAELG